MKSLVAYLDYNYDVMYNFREVIVPNIVTAVNKVITFVVIWRTIYTIYNHNLNHHHYLLLQIIPMIKSAKYQIK